MNNSSLRTSLTSTEHVLYHHEGDESFLERKQRRMEMSMCVYLPPEHGEHGVLWKRKKLCGKRKSFVEKTRNEIMWRNPLDGNEYVCLLTSRTW
ncbi:hypothetical protein TSUD_132130 [Trifolium subterraneum]|uniref:Uncharacterized protein n=1 Tax=Trifolium subterraneum TaxID=3900 RepID=A0A2Z6M280_TRISU|nr:hypothetical protein TSUD_132130 [Trifolium subterraneum]